MMFAFPKLNDGKTRHTNATWLLIFSGTNIPRDENQFEILIGWCSDLVDARLDRGRQVPALLAFQWRWLPRDTRKELGIGPLVSFKFRSDWRFIFERLNQRRLANADV